MEKPVGAQEQVHDKEKRAQMEARLNSFLKKMNWAPVDGCSDFDDRLKDIQVSLRTADKSADETSEARITQREDGFAFSVDAAFSDPEAMSGEGPAFDDLRVSFRLNAADLTLVRSKQFKDVDGADYKSGEDGIQPEAMAFLGEAIEERLAAFIRNEQLPESERQQSW